MDRPINYPGQVLRDIDLLGGWKDVLYGVGHLAQALIGTSTAVAGLGISATSPPSLTVNIGAGSIYTQEEVDASAYGSLGLDANSIVKQGILPSPTQLSITPPTTSGYSQYFLVEAQYSDVDSGATVLPYYNSANPLVPLSGPSGSGASQNTVRQGVCVVTIKPGIAAPTGTQVAPSPDSGYVGLWLILVTFGQSQITSANWSQYSGAPFIQASLGQIPQDIQDEAWTYWQDTGTANALVITPTPAVSGYQAGQRWQIKLANSITGPSTANINGLGARSLILNGGGATANLDFLAGQVIDVIDSGSALVILTPIDRLIVDTALSFTVNGSSPNFANLATAMAWVSRRRISSTGSVTFNVAAGKFTYSAGLLIDHPDGLRISIIGATPGSMPAMTSWAAGGSSSGQRATDAATNLTAARAWLATELAFTGANGIDMRRIGDFSNILVSSDGTAGTDGITVRFGYNNLSGVAVAGFSGRGVVGVYSGLTLQNVIAIGNGSDGIQIENTCSASAVASIGSFNNGGHGISSTGSLTALSGVAICGSGNAQDGVTTSHGQLTTGLTNASFAKFNGVNGFSSYEEGAMICNSAIASNNGSNGFASTDSAWLNGQSTTGSSNGAFGFAANYGCIMHATSSTATGSSGSLSPAANTVGNSNSLIIV